MKYSVRCIQFFESPRIQVYMEVFTARQIYTRNLPWPRAAQRDRGGVDWKGVLETKQPPVGDQIILRSDSNCKVNKGCICKVRFKFGVETWAGKLDCICVLGLATDLCWVQNSDLNDNVNLARCFLWLKKKIYFKYIKLLRRRPELFVLVSIIHILLGTQWNLEFRAY